MGRRKTFQGNPIEDLPSKTPTKKRARNKRRASSPLKMEPNFDTFSHTLPTGIDDLPVLYEMPQEDDLDLPESELNPILSKDDVPIKIPSAVQNALNDPEIVSGAVANTTLADSLLDLEDEAAQQAIARQQEMAVKKGTEPAYARQLERYEMQWALREERRLEEAREKGIEYTVVPAHPITPMKVAIYAEEERKRERLDRKGKPIPNTRISWRTVTQAISALENYRFIHHRKDPRYVNCPQAQSFLRNDPDVRSVEKAARQGDAERQNEFCQEVKANGVQSQTFSEDQYKEVSVGLMTGKKTAQQTIAYLRDRCMLIISATMALRGDNVRPVRLSDLSMRDVPLVNIAHDFKAKAFVVFSNQGKTNVNGRIDEHSAFRHRDPDLCVLNALGMYLFGLYHIEKRSPPSFAPDWKHDKATQIGYRDWYNILLFPGGKNDREEMNDAYHRKRVNHFKLQFDIFCDKATHGGRVRAANVAIENGATVEGTMSLGNWSQSGSFRACYNRVLPTDAMLALAGFNGERKDSYFICRDELKPPPDLVSSIFPWIEDEEKAYQRRIEEHGNEARDNALVYYLNLLRYLRTALLQDMAVMASQHPDLFLLHFAPFNTNSFREFASQSTAIINTVEGEAKANLKHLPEQYAASVSGALRSTMIKQEQHRHAVEEQNLELRRDMFELIQSLGDCLSAPKSKKRKFSESLVQRFTGASSKYITGLAPGPTMPDPPRPTKQVHLEPEPPAPSDSESLEIAPNPISSAQTPTAATTSTFSPKAPAISGSGTVYSFATFPLSTNLEMRATQVREISVLEKKLSPGQLKHNSFEWVENSPKQGVGEWIPEFSGYWKPPSNQTASLKDIWNENEYGIGHRFSIKQPRAHWGVRWRRNVNGLKVEGVRREKVVELVRRLIAQEGWDEEKALRFLEERCPIPSKTFMDECVAGTHSAGLHHQFAGGPLRIFFFRLAQLLKIPANFVFVFDGPNKPEKRGHGAQSQPALWWVDDVQRLIESFGFYTHEAPGEAEAELALLNQWGMIDMMWTSDSDSMVFGGQTVLRAIPSRERSTGRLDELKLYTAEDVRNKLGLDRGRLILYSLVAGGDYGEGLHGGGMVSASEIALSPIGRDLQSYLNPSTSLSHPAYLPAADNWFSIQQPDVSRIVNLCRQRLGWSRNSAKLRNVLRNNVWEGVILRLALSNRCVWKRETSSFGTPSCRLQVKSCRTMVTKALNPEHEEECVRLGVNEADLIVETLTEEHRRFLELPVLLNVVKPTVIRAWLVPSLVPEWLLELCDPVKRRGKKRARSGQDQTGPVKQKSKVKGKGRKHNSPLLSLTELIFGTSPGTPEPSTAAGTSSLNVGPSCAGTSSLNVGPSCAGAGASSSVPGTSSLGLMGSQGPAEGSSSSPNWLATIGSNNSEVIDLTSTVSSEVIDLTSDVDDD
ncbi:hypothetical protein D9611_014463 [Ephemerocybe angulata]|uniref:XPG-I domain-containing protein n=1 Tax=Ephemerocybe angulata TaxID=980116 RepID=A0A8H5C5N8_9AGAR|nr:hypothetical protein D9611_014463 [Tulosesus angulatus]